MTNQINRPTELFLKLLRRKIYPAFFKQEGLPALQFSDDIRDCQTRMYNGLIVGVILC